MTRLLSGAVLDLAQPLFQVALSRLGFVEFQHCPALVLSEALFSFLVICSQHLDAGLVFRIQARDVGSQAINALVLTGDRGALLDQLRIELRDYFFASHQFFLEQGDLRVRRRQFVSEFPGFRFGVGYQVQRMGFFNVELVALCLQRA